MNHIKSLSFAATHKDFFTTLNLRINRYFRENELPRTANSEMVLKTVFMFLLYLAPYVAIMSGVITSLTTLLLSYFVMGIGLAGIGLSVMHDANHGAYSRKSWVNTLLGYSLNLIGGHATNWKVQHNVLHHTYTNVHEADEDISPRGVLRLAPGSAWKPAHRFQYIYAWFLYCLLTLAWVFVKDFSRLKKYHREGLLEKQNTDAAHEWIILILTKLTYLFYIIVLPAWLLPFSIWEVLCGFLLMHAVAGFMLSVIFQPAHVAEGTEYPEPDANGRLENSWAVHQLHTTTNFAPDRKLFSWFVGGLNYQIEHHLFPNICHVHYRNIAPIVEQTAREFNLPYRSLPSFRKALKLHTRLLKKLGKKP
ncbi:MAG: acyl-CoA desaturase [Cyclobacteriaceae bacterium]|nr:acyl-CoA desaturase [Cyclobacteriaceae bacterium]MCX7636632.1 acyl-CoA desaturase [Cyclobacteriaceae bacterium]MDW8331866.1 acyl-CoA desaturase [Cyclobacteriaceae bacterium]